MRTALGLGAGLPFGGGLIGSGLSSGTSTQALIAALAAAGRKGFFPSTNPSTGWWQDSAGTVPAVLEGPVGRITDLSGNAYHATQATSANRPTYTRKVNIFTSTTDTVTTARTGDTVAGAYTLYVGSGSVTLSGTATGTYGAGSHSVTCTAGTLTATPTGTVTNLDCRLAAFAAMNMPAYQSVTSATVYDTAGFRDMLYYDGVNDSLATSAIDLTGANKIQALVNALKVSDAAAQMVYETSANVGSNTGCFYLIAPSGAAGNNIAFANKGTSQVTPSSALVAPAVAVVRARGDIAAPYSGFSVNGAADTSSTTSLGTGNYGNHPLNIGARNVAGTPGLHFKGYVIPGPLFDSTGIDAGLLDAVAREHAALWGVTV